MSPSLSSLLADTPIRPVEVGVVEAERCMDSFGLTRRPTGGCTKAGVVCTREARKRSDKGWCRGDMISNAYYRGGEFCCVVSSNCVGVLRELHLDLD